MLAQLVPLHQHIRLCEYSPCLCLVKRLQYMLGVREPTHSYLLSQS